MNDSQISGVYEVKVGANSSAAEMAKKVSEVETYLKDRLDEIKTRISTGRRSIFDFADLAIILSSLVFYNSGQTHGETSRYIDFIKSHLIPQSDPNNELIATAFYCIMRCGLIHEMSLGGHGISTSNQNILSGYKVSVTHDSSNKNWFHVDSSLKEIRLFMPELIRAVEKCLNDCFTKGDIVRTSIENMIGVSGIKIVKVVQQSLGDSNVG